MLAWQIFAALDSFLVTGDANNYRSLMDLVERAGAPVTLAELHGGLCGVICAGGREAAARWLQDLLDDCTGDDTAQAELARELDRLCASSWAALNGVSLEFMPLLPEDRAAIAERTDAIAVWCHGFLAGLVLGGVDLTQGADDLGPELAELIGDFAEISKAGAAAADLADPEASEESLTGLAEFVRVGVQFVFEELTPADAVPERRALH